MTPGQTTSKTLPSELTKLVRTTIDLLGHSIEDVYGKKCFQQVEKIRKDMKRNRGSDPHILKEVLKKHLKKLRTLHSTQLYELGHSFALYLELINRCEKAYRYHRLKEKSSGQTKKSPYAIIYVFTAHPTEARSPQILQLFDQIEGVLTQLLESPENPEYLETLSHLINLTLRTSMSKSQDPSVKDEAWHIFSVVLAPQILSRQIDLKRRGVTVNFRTWVGGDKDGHPYVNEKTLLASLQMSRELLHDYFEDRLKNSLKRFELVENTKIVAASLTRHRQLIKELNSLKVLKKGDGWRIEKVRNLFVELYEKHLEVFESHCPDLNAAKELLWLYPALVLPLEVREDSEVILESLKSKNDLPIKKMLKALKDISEGFNPKWYVRGLVISMTRDESDISNGIELINKVFSTLVIPVVPLFETRQALEDSTKILNRVFNKRLWLKDHHKKVWDRRFEIMLGYSDSSKESGVLSSRFLIGDALQRLDKFFKSQDLIPVFFHGSGGSIERGGGSIKEQTSWWPKSALNIFKATVQGEMVSRSFGNPLIMQGQIEKILAELPSKRKGVTPNKLNQSLKKLSDLSAQEYQSLIKSEQFIKIVQQATPYLYLDQLKIGSRPSKRQTGSREIKLRAIPWVLCWTQTRTLLPTWYGIGTAWENLPIKDKYALVSQLDKSEFLISFTKILGFTIAKIELGVFALYLEQNLSTKEAREFFEYIQIELDKTKTFLKELTRKETPLWFRPWLQESIHMRSSMIHPLNLIQLIALEREDPRLLRESVTGIACGMLTTG